MKRTLACFCSLMIALTAYAQDGCARLRDIFSRAEHCYMIDDYRSLDKYLQEYEEAHYACNAELGDSADVYAAYYFKMYGAFYYGLSEKDSGSAYDAIDAYKRSLEVFENRNSEINATRIHEELAQLYYRLGEYETAQNHLDSAHEFYQKRALFLGIESELSDYYKNITQRAICNARQGNFNLALTQVDNAINSFFKKHKDEDYYEALRKKGKILMIRAERGENGDYKEARECYSRYVEERCRRIEAEMDTLSKEQREQYWLSTHRFLYDCYRLGNLAPEMLYDLALFSKDFLVRRNAKRTRWQQIRNVLRSDECAIEFTQYFGKDDERRMGCLVLHNDGRPHFIDLFSTDSVLALPLTYSYTIGEALSRKDGMMSDLLYTDRRLPHLIWSDKLMHAIGNATTVYFAPDGLFHQIAIEYLMPQDEKTCYRLSSTRTLLRKKDALKLEKALLLGGIEYDTPYHSLKKGNDVEAYRYLIEHAGDISYLPHTKEEVDSIIAIRRNANDILLSGKAATDEAFMQQLSESHDLIHIATHGYFGGETGIYNDLKPLLWDESMSWSGLLFSGVHSTLANRHFDETRMDGILSATELSSFDLSRTKLVVLSACQSGIGHITDDGMYGIQRGLKMAGVNTMMLTLWDVNDYSGNRLMYYFYKELEAQTNKNFYSAFLAARRQLMSETYNYITFDPATLSFKLAKIKFCTPQHINAYILIDAI